MIRKKNVCVNHHQKKPVTSNLYPMAKICFLITLFLFTATSAFTKTRLLRHLGAQPRKRVSSLHLIQHESQNRIRHWAVWRQVNAHAVSLQGDKNEDWRSRWRLTASSERWNSFQWRVEWIAENLRASLWNKGFSNVVNYSFEPARTNSSQMKPFYQCQKNYHNYWVFDRSLTGADRQLRQAPGRQLRPSSDWHVSHGRLFSRQSETSVRY